MRVDIEKWITTTFRRGNKKKKKADEEEEAKKKNESQQQQQAEGGAVAQVSQAPSTSSIFSRKSKSSKKSDKNKKESITKLPLPVESSTSSSTIAAVAPPLSKTQSCSNLSSDEHDELPCNMSSSLSSSSSGSSYVEDIIIEQHFEVEQKLYQFNGPLSEFTSCMDQQQSSMLGSSSAHLKPIPIDCLNINARNIEIKPTKFRITYAGIDDTTENKKPHTELENNNNNMIGSIILPITNNCALSTELKQEQPPTSSQVDTTLTAEWHDVPVESLDESVEKSVKSDIISKEAASPPTRKILVNETTTTEKDEDHMDRCKQTRSSLASVDNIEDPPPLPSVILNKENKPNQQLLFFTSSTATAAAQTANRHAMWLDLSASLNRLDNNSNNESRQADLLIEDLIKLEAYLNNELDSTHNNDMFFSGPDQITDHINKTIKIKLFRLSQSTSLFEELKKKIIALLSSHLNLTHQADEDDDDQVECLKKFEQLEKSYLNLYDTVKSRLKLSMSKLERFVNIWNEFDLDCRHLDDLFSASSDPNTIQYQSRLIEIGGYLNKLMEQRGQLTSICDEEKYFELRNRIMAYELKLNKLKTEHEQQQKQSKLQNDIPATSSTPLAVAPQSNNDSSPSDQKQQVLVDDVMARQKRRIVFNTTQQSASSSSSSSSLPTTTDKITAESLSPQHSSHPYGDHQTLQRIPPLEIRISHNHFNTTSPTSLVPQNHHPAAAAATHHHYINHYANEYYDNVDSTTTAEAGDRQYDIFVPHCVSPITESPQEEQLQEDHPLIKSPPPPPPNRIPTPPYPYLVDRSMAQQKLIKPVHSEYRKPETSNKSTWTINDMSTQTDTPPPPPPPTVVMVGGEEDNQIEEQPVRLVSLSTTPIKSCNKENVIKLTRSSSSNVVPNKVNKQSSSITHTYLARNQLESDGKKLLLEAYLRNNNNTTNQEASVNNKTFKTNDLKQQPSAVSTSLTTTATTNTAEATSRPKKKQSRPLSARIVDTITSSTITHGESGIGTGTNDDEEQDSLESMLPGEDDDDDDEDEEFYEDHQRANIYEIHQMMYCDDQHNNNNNNDKTSRHHGDTRHEDADESASDEVVILTSASSCSNGNQQQQQQTGPTDELYVNINCRKLTKKGKSVNKEAATHTLKSSSSAARPSTIAAYLAAAPITSSSATSSSPTRPLKQQHQRMEQRQTLLLKRDVMKPSYNDDHDDDFKQEESHKLQSRSENHQPSTTRSSSRSKVKAAVGLVNSLFWRLLTFFVFFLLPLLLVLAGYLIYALYLNPTCCDFERSYLFINVT